MAEWLTSVLEAGDVVVLRGEIGAGKTTFVRAAARFLGVVGPVTSPTFTVANRYEGRVPVTHIDAYRLSGVDDEELAMLLDVAEGAITFIEWPDMLGDALPESAASLEIEHLGGDGRRITVSTEKPVLMDE